MSRERGAAAVERLTRSREQLRLAWRGPSHSGTGGEAAAPWLESVLAVPGVGLVVEAIRSWWRQHPLHMAGGVAADTVKSILKPIVRKNPIGAMLAAAALGGLIVWTRPWRWLGKPAFVTGLLPQLVHEALAQVPLQSVLLALAALARQQAAAGEAAAAGAKDPQPPAPATAPGGAAAQSQ